MAWKVNGLMSQRQAFVELAQCPERNMAALCREYGITRPTGYKWLERGLAGALREQSRRPHSSPQQTDAVMEAKVLELRRAHPTWGGRKLRARLQQEAAQAAAAGAGSQSATAGAAAAAPAVADCDPAPAAAACAASCCRRARSLRPPQVGCARRSSSTFASMTASVCCGLLCGRRDCSRSAPARPRSSHLYPVGRVMPYSRQSAAILRSGHCANSTKACRWDIRPLTFHAMNWLLSEPQHDT